MSRPRVLAVLVVSTVASNVALSQTLVFPGETRENLAAVGQVISVTSPGGSVVRFDREDAFSQNIRVLADPHVQTGGITGEHRARGALILDFCIPEQGQSTCTLAGNPGASDVVVNVSFEYEYVARVSAFGPTAVASYGASGSLIDLARSTYVAYESFGGISARRGQIKEVAGVKFPVPDIDFEEITEPVTFTALLRRGKIYRFQLAASAYVNFGLFDLGDTISDASNEFGFLPLLGGGRTTLRNLSITVGSDAADLEDRIEDLENLTQGLQRQVGELSAQLEEFQTIAQDEHATLRSRTDEISSLVDPAGSILMLPGGSQNPAGYTYIGTFDLAPSGSSRGRGVMMQVDVYRKNPE